MVANAMPGIVVGAVFVAAALLFRWAAKEDADTANRMGLYIIIPILWAMAGIGFFSALIGAFAAPT